MQKLSGITIALQHSSGLVLSPNPPGDNDSSSDPGWLFDHGAGAADDRLPHPIMNSRRPIMCNVLFRRWARAAIQPPCLGGNPLQRAAIDAPARFAAVSNAPR